MSSKIDETLNAFIERLFLQRRRSALRGPRGGAIISDPRTVDAILGDPKTFRKAYGLLEFLGRSRFSTDGADS